MPPETEHAEGPSTLPPPELNPLLNPLLAQNMGRWAQVYFTSAPDKRNQAVQELLRQLEAENPTRAETGVPAPSSVTPSSAAPSSGTEHGSTPAGSPTSQSPEIQPAPVRCHACGRKNPSTQKFCGMCGTRLAEPGTVDEPRRYDLQGEESQTVDRHVEDRHVHVEDRRTRNHPIEDRYLDHPPPDEPASFVQSQESQFVPPDHNGYEPSSYEGRSNTNELSLFQTGRDVGDYNDEDSYEILSTPRGFGSYRIYVGIVLAIFIGALAYLAWRSTQASSQASHAGPSAPSAAAEEPVNSATVPPSPSKADTPDRTTAENPLSPSRGAEQPVRNGADKAARAAQRTSISEKNSQGEVWAGTGADELAVAQGYLNGTNGQGRNSTEAAKWLWKAIAKHNGEATFLLSEMYLKGDGVSKNCDQAHVLLDAAALKGVKGAGERLRHLQAFGCQ